MCEHDTELNILYLIRITESQLEEDFDKFIEIFKQMGNM